jgi:hypothetical protein
MVHTFAVVMGAALYGFYVLLTGKLPVENAAVVGMVAGFVGIVIGYVSANAQQVVSFFFGNSKGSETKRKRWHRRLRLRSARVEWPRAATGANGRQQAQGLRNRLRAKKKPRAGAACGPRPTRHG